MSGKLIVGADDFGRNKDNTDAIVFAHKFGVISSTTVLTERSAFDYAAKIVKKYPNLKTGLHIDLDHIFFMEEPKGFFKRLPKVTSNMKGRIEGEIDRQLEKFLKSGLVLSHFDSHHHSHMHLDVLPIVAKKAKELNIPIRFHRDYYNCSKFLYRNLEKEVLIPILKEFNLKYPQFCYNRFALTGDYKIGEVVLHPGFSERWRAYDLATSCNPELKDKIKQNNIEIISFADL
jgi:predicted glycoside hydrolase/deacetylase ChbG (UPF0249 family)